MSDVHETAVIDPGAVIGEGTKVWHFAHVMPGARIGRGCMLGQNVFVGEGVEIGDGVKIQNNVSVFSGVMVEDDVFLGPSVVFTNVGRPRSASPHEGAYERTLVMRGATIGANATIVCGVSIGRCAFVAAGAVVTHDVPDHAMVMGTPARLTTYVCECAGSLPDLEAAGSAVCPACGRSYSMRDGVVAER